ncbi:MAG: VanZ family protein [Clostridia bacterium]|nr:VanZ family protein [Clostridia bacterium]
MKNNIIRYSALVLLVFSMCAIFYFSAQPADVSEETSNGVIEKMISVFYPEYNGLDDFAKQDIVITFVVPIRKLAHFLEFFMLGGSTYVFVSTFNGFLKKYRFLISLSFAVFYAICDELHQIFVPGRACRFSDILVDSVGALTAILIFVLILRIRRRRKGEQ